MSLKGRMIKCLPTIPNGIEVYLFGSLLKTEECNDIDLAIIYDKDLIGIEDTISIRTNINNVISKELELPVEILLLSKEENIQTEFISNLKTELLNASR